jgi:hypothetical protein
MHVRDDGSFAIERAAPADAPPAARAPVWASSDEPATSDWLLATAPGEAVEAAIPAEGLAELRGGQVLRMGEELASPSGRFVAALNRSQLCVYDLRRDAADEPARWCSMHPAHVLAPDSLDVRKFEPRDCQQASYAINGSKQPLLGGCVLKPASLWRGLAKWDDVRADAPSAPVLTLALEQLDTLNIKTRRGFSVGYKLRGDEGALRTVDLCVRHHQPDAALQQASLRKELPSSFRWCALLTVPGAVTLAPYSPTPPPPPKLSLAQRIKALMSRPKVRRDLTPARVRASKRRGAARRGAT